MRAKIFPSFCTLPTYVVHPICLCVKLTVWSLHPRSKSQGLCASLNHTLDLYLLDIMFLWLSVCKAVQLANWLVYLSLSLYEDTTYCYPSTYFTFFQSNNIKSSTQENVDGKLLRKEKVKMFQQCHASSVGKLSFFTDLSGKNYLNRFKKSLIFRLRARVINLKPTVKPLERDSPPQYTLSSIGENSA